MNKLGIFFWFLVISFFTQAQDFQWAQQDGGSLDEAGASISVDHDGNAYITGFFIGVTTIGDSTFTAAGNEDIYIAKYTSDGIFVWAQQAGGTGYDRGNEISVDETGNVYVTGWFEGMASIGDSLFTTGGGSADIFMVKYDQDGNFLWAQQLGGNLTDWGNGISIDHVGNVCVTGRFEGMALIGDSTFTSVGNSDIFITKYDQNGNFLWAQQAGGIGFDMGLGISADGIGNVYVTGYFNSTASIGDSTFTSLGVEDIFIAKYDQSGNFIWAKHNGGILGDFGVGISVDNFGNSYTTGSFRGTANLGDSLFTAVGEMDLFIIKYDQNGNFNWAIQEGGANNDEGIEIFADHFGCFFVVGWFTSTATIGDSIFSGVGGSTDILLAKYDQGGNFNWALQAGGRLGEQGRGVAADTVGNVYMTGFFSETAFIGDSTFTSAGNADIFIAKFGPSGGVSEPGSTIPSLSEWGLLILALFLMIVGIVAVRQRIVHLAEE